MIIPTFVSEFGLIVNIWTNRHTYRHLVKVPLVIPKITQKSILVHVYR